MAFCRAQANGGLDRKQVAIDNLIIERWDQL